MESLKNQVQVDLDRGEVMEVNRGMMEFFQGSSRYL